METNDSLQHLTPIAKLLIPRYKEKHDINLTSNLIIHREEIQELKENSKEIQALKEKLTAEELKKKSLCLYTLDGPVIDRTLGQIHKDGPAIEKILTKDLPPLGTKGQRAGYLFYNTVCVTKFRYDDKSHCELLLVEGDKTIIPISFFGTPYIDILPKSYYRLPVTTDMNIAPSSGSETECNLLSILYAKTLLKNDGQYLKESIFFEKYNSNGEIERIFVPHPEVLKYSHSNQYNKYILSLTSDGKYSHKIKWAEEEKAFKYPSIREMLSESIENLENLRINNPKAFTEEMEKMLAENKALLAELPSINEKFKTHYESKVLPWRENIREGEYTPWDKAKRGKLKKKLPAYADAYLRKTDTSETISLIPKTEEGDANICSAPDENIISEASQVNFEKNDEDKNIYLISEIIRDLWEAIIELLRKICNKLIGENKENNKADNNLVGITNISATPADVIVTEGSEPLTIPNTPEASKTLQLKPIAPQDSDTKAKLENAEEKPISLINNSAIINDLASNIGRNI